MKKHFRYAAAAVSAMTEKQKEVLERMSKAIEPLNDDQLDDLLKIGDGMIIMQDIMTRTRNKEAS